MIDDLARLTDDVLSLRSQGRTLDPAALTLLLRCYRATERGDVREALEPALGAALDQPFDALSAARRAAYLKMLVEALPLLDDARVRGVVGGLADGLASSWGTGSPIEERTAALDACLLAAAALDARAIVAPAIDELERVIGEAYVPGSGLRGRPETAVRDRLGDHVSAALALLTAHATTARVPYAMLAEELMQFSKRALWSEPPGHPFAVECDAVKVYCRLAALHGSADYRASAVVADAADYHGDAAALLTALSARLPGRAFECADYALALDEWLSRS